MTYKEVNRDLFSAPSNTYYAHCISADFALGAGIAVEFVKRFDMKKKLFELFPESLVSMYHEYAVTSSIVGYCVNIDRVFNLITKEKYYQKPTYESIRQALVSMRITCLAHNIKNVAMPRIGCGLDRLSWNKVSKMIQEIFGSIDITITVYSK